MPKGASAIGIEIDSQAIRAARVAPGRGGGAHATVSAIEEVGGSFTTDEQIVEGLRMLRKRLEISFADTVVTCVGGKQVYATQMMFKKLSDDEMKTALKFEIRKNLPFDTANATIEYQFLSQPSKKNEFAPLIVTAVANTLLRKTLALFEKAGLPPTIIDLFPLTVANSLWAGKLAAGAAPDTAATVLHIGPEFSTVVIDGDKVPFFTRTIYFNTVESPVAAQQTPVVTTTGDFDRKAAAYTEEISRSLAYYRTTFRTRTAPSLVVLGAYALPELLDKIMRDTSLTISRLDLVSDLDAHQTAPAGKFDIAVTLGLRGME